MKHSTIIIALALVLAIFLCLLSYRYFFKSWTPYYQEKLYKEPRPLLIEALKLFEQFPNKEKKALDLGSGVGNDTAFLLKNGWQVWANDVEREAIDIIASRKDVQDYKEKLILVHKDFVDLPWRDFPKFDLIYASYALPFARRNDFMKIWEHIVQELSSGGIFAGHFFGPGHGAFNWWIKRKMTFLTKDQLLEMFKDFKIEFFNEFYEKNNSGIFNHSFDVIAKKI